MNRTERLYAIVNELQLAAPRGRTAAWLAKRFEVSTRTIKRDMRALHEARVGLVADEGRGGGYSLDRTARLPPIGFTAAEATALAVAIGAAPDLPYRADGQSAMAKILAAMTREQRRTARDVAGRLWVREGQPRSRWARVVDEGLRRRVVMHIDYIDERGRTTLDRPVEPMALVRTKHHWHLLA
ncbi:MAG: HTH domain-containing protein [Myxococcota bacterium]